MRSLFSVLAVAFLFPPQNATAPPAGAVVVATVQGRGVQIYRCGMSQWTLDGPEAELFDPAGKLVGKHSAGPVWVWSDGSSIQGKVLAKEPSPDAGSIPWLLLEAHPLADSTTGKLSGVTRVRRSETAGGSAPATGCDVVNEGARVRVPYKATYTFYE